MRGPWFLARFGSGRFRLLVLAALFVLSGCASGPNWSGIWSGYWILAPRGPVAAAAFRALVVDVIGLLVIIGPTTVLLTWVLFRYRRAAKARHDPHWDHSLLIEVFSWGLPFTIVILLGFVSYEGAFAVNPFAPGVLANQPGQAPRTAPIDVDVITTDWQWLFVYRAQHVAVANELVVPVGTPVRLRMTSATVTNDVFIPELVGQIDVMPGMRTRQSFLVPDAGTYQGFSSNYSGPGFSWMRFQTKAVAAADFRTFLANAAKSPDHLSYARFDDFAKPTINQFDHQYVFSDVPDDLFDHVVGEVVAGKTWPTPAGMTEKMSSNEPGRKQPLQAQPLPTTRVP